MSETEKKSGLNIRPAKIEDVPLILELSIGLQSLKNSLTLSQSRKKP